MFHQAVCKKIIIPILHGILHIQCVQPVLIDIAVVIPGDADIIVIHPLMAEEQKHNSRIIFQVVFIQCFHKVQFLILCQKRFHFLQKTFVGQFVLLKVGKLFSKYGDKTFHGHSGITLRHIRSVLLQCVQNLQRHTVGSLPGGMGAPYVSPPFQIIYLIHILDNTDRTAIEILCQPAQEDAAVSHGIDKCRQQHALHRRH